LAYHHAGTMMHFATGGELTRPPEDLTARQKIGVLLTGVKVPRPESRRSPSELADDCGTLTVDAPGDVTLEAWYCDRGRGSPLVILFHGYAAEKSSLLDEARVFLGLGASVMLVDFRGSGGSSASYTTIGLLEAVDVAAVAGYVRANLSHARVVLFGQSMGGVAILRSVRNHGIRSDAVILEGVFDTMLNTVRNRFEAIGVPSFPSAQLLVFWGARRWGFDGFSHNPVDYAGSLRDPVVFMHGEDDTRARLQQGRRVFDAVPGRKTFVKFDNTGHGSYLAADPARWRSAVEALIVTPASQVPDHRSGDRRRRGGRL
jgi:pimeloyl-ACP methyl ester carboxylesterase